MQKSKSIDEFVDSEIRLESAKKSKPIINEVVEDDIDELVDITDVSGKEAFELR